MSDLSRLAAALETLPKASLLQLSRLLDQVCAADELPGIAVGEDIPLPLYTPESADTFGVAGGDWEQMPNEIAATWGVG